jgi:hypothetical protein
MIELNASDIRMALILLPFLAVGIAPDQAGSAVPSAGGIAVCRFHWPVNRGFCRDCSDQLCAPRRKGFSPRWHCYKNLAKKLDAYVKLKDVNHRTMVSIGPACVAILAGRPVEAPATLAV